uniref:Mediator of RNA polymerase II transcription subunit 11 n=1 Tax=Alexandrium monilatum TaxID=311494 RepID=A0A7S4UAR0_9DINO
MDGLEVAAGKPPPGPLAEGELLVERVRGRLAECFELAARTAEVLGSARAGDAPQAEAESLAAAYNVAVAAIHRDLHAAIDTLPEADVTYAEVHSYRENLAAQYAAERVQLDRQLREDFPGLAEARPLRPAGGVHS